MKTTALTGLFAAASLIGIAGEVAPASAFTWNNSWNQPTIYSNSQTNFNDAPFQQFVQVERVALPNVGMHLLDANNLRLRYAHDVSVYFINEGAGYRNQLAYEATGATPASGLIFNDISSAESIGNWGGDALDLGDGVKLGSFQANTQLDFWLRANGLDWGNSANIFGTQVASNADRLEHAVAYAYNNYLLLGFEDLYGELNASGTDGQTGLQNERSDRDFNDTVFVVDIGEENVRYLVDGPTSVPEPSITFGLMGIGLCSLLGVRRRRQEANL
jgi:hypothetical protein